MSCCLGSTPFYFWKHLDIVRHIEFKNAFPQIRSRERKFEQRLARGLFWSRLSNLITIPDCFKEKIVPKNAIFGPNFRPWFPVQVFVRSQTNATVSSFIRSPNYTQSMKEGFVWPFPILLNP